VTESVCDHCGAWLEEHGYEHEARVCFPKQIDALEKQLHQLKASAGGFRAQVSKEREKRQAAQARVRQLEEALEWAVEGWPEIYGNADPEKGEPLTPVARALAPPNKSKGGQ
jgi:hypothetical protein